MTEIITKETNGKTKHFKWAGLEFIAQVDDTKNSDIQQL